MKKYKGIIFDLDGTLLDTLIDISDSVNIALSKYEYPKHDYQEYKLMLGNGFRVLIEKSVPAGTSEEMISDVLKLFIKNYNENYKNKTQPYDGIVEMLIELDKMGIKIGVNSNKRNDYTVQLVSKYFKDFPFIEVFGERDKIPKKPDPTSANEIAKLMELNHDEILYIGDSNTDILTSINAKMDGVGVLWGFRSFEELKKFGAKYIVSEPKEIIEIVKNN